MMPIITLKDTCERFDCYGNLMTWNTGHPTGFWSCDKCGSIQTHMVPPVIIDRDTDQLAFDFTVKKESEERPVCVCVMAPCSDCPIHGENV